MSHAYSFLPTASEAMLQSQDSVLIAEEVLLITVNVLNAIEANDRSIVIDTNTQTTINGVIVTGTPMTINEGSSHSFYNVWKGLEEDVVKSGAMLEVINFYTSRGYTISRKSNDSTTMYWVISW